VLVFEHRVFLLSFHLSLVNIYFTKEIYMWCVIFLSIFVIVLGGCSDNSGRTTIMVTPMFEQQKVSCDSLFNVDGNAWQYQTLQFFISQVEVKNQEGQWRLWDMTESAQQKNNIALLGEDCSTKNSASNRHWQLEFKSIGGMNKFEHIRFMIGIPFNENHLNPLTQTSPLNESSMFWVWQTGHKFLRLEMKSDDDNWLFHLGSTGCESPSVMRSPANECAQPNRIYIEFDLNSQQEIIIDLAKLLEGVNLKADSRCLSAPNNVTCQQLFNNMMSDEQQVFKASRHD